MKLRIFDKIMSEDLVYQKRKRLDEYLLEVFISKRGGSERIFELEVENDDLKLQISHLDLIIAHSKAFSQKVG